MLVRTTALCALASLALALSAAPSEACTRRASTACVCYPIYPCQPAHGCCVYSVSEPTEPLNGKYSMAERPVKVGHGVIVQVEVPADAKPAPLGVFVVSVTGPGDLRYEGWNKKTLSSGKDLYSFFLCPTKCGKAQVDVTFVMSGNANITVPFVFKVDC